MFLLTSFFSPYLISAGHIFLKTSIKDASKFSYNLYIVVSDKYGTVTDKLLTILVTGKDIFSLHEIVGFFNRLRWIKQF